MSREQDHFRNDRREDLCPHGEHAAQCGFCQKSDVESLSDPEAGICNECGSAMRLEDGCDPTDLCHQCEIKKLTTIIDALPHTADGEPMLVGMNCWTYDEAARTIGEAGILSIAIDDDAPSGAHYKIELRDQHGNEWECWEDGIWAFREGADAARKEDAMLAARSHPQDQGARP